MTDKAPDDKEPADEAYEEFQRTVRNLVNTPHKPHVPPAEGDPTKRKIQD
jgi:hypothetical protein